MKDNGFNVENENKIRMECSRSEKVIKKTGIKTPNNLKVLPTLTIHIRILILT